MMNTFIDSNILIYAFNEGSNYNKNAIELIDKIIHKNNLFICDISLIEFFQIITDKSKIKNSLSNNDAVIILQKIINNKKINILSTTIDIISAAFNTTVEYSVIKYEIYDHLIAINLRENNIREIYTVNDKDFNKYEFLNVINPFK